MRRGLLHPRLYRTHTGHGGVPGVLLIRHSPGPRIGVNDSILLGYTEGTRATHVRSGSKPEVAALRRGVCFAPVSGHRQAVSACSKRAHKCPEEGEQKFPYSITSSG